MLKVLKVTSSFQLVTCLLKREAEHWRAPSGALTNNLIKWKVLESVVGSSSMKRPHTRAVLRFSPPCSPFPGCSVIGTRPRAQHSAWEKQVPPLRAYGPQRASEFPIPRPLATRSGPLSWVHCGSSTWTDTGKHPRQFQKHGEFCFILSCSLSMWSLLAWGGQSQSGDPGVTLKFWTSSPETRVSDQR